jgi:RimJ/RimL family protein N-acetyltransferase
MVLLKRTDSEDINFQQLVTRLDADLAIRDGADHAYYAQFNTTNQIRNAIVGYQDDLPVACGAFKPFSAGTVEIKRMFVDENQRGKGIALQVLSELEKWAIEDGNHTCVLETGKNQPEAIRLYQKAGYARIPNYGQYAIMENSLCFQKRILAIQFQFQPMVLENDELKLVPLKEGDLEALYDVAADPLIWAGHPKKDRYKKEVFLEYFNSAVQDKNAFLIYDKASTEIIGSTRYYGFDPQQSRIAIGYTFLTRKYWGGHYNRSLKFLMLDYAFQFINSVVFHIGATNIRSQRAIEKIGAIKIGEMDLDFNGTKQLHFEYEIRKENFKQLAP